MLCVLIIIDSSGDSNEYTHIPYQYKKKIIPNTIMSAGMGFFIRDENEFEIALVKEPSVFKPLKFYCI